MKGNENYLRLFFNQSHHRDHNNKFMDNHCENLIIS